MGDIVLYQLPGAFGLESLSPFCTKLGAYLRLAGFQYESAAGNPQEAPKGKLPYARIDGSLVGDSGIIIERLEARSRAPLDAALTPRQRALGHLVRRTAEEHLYWGIVQMRWDDERTWQGTFARTLASVLPPGLRWFLPGILRRGIRKQLHAHGLGRHTSDDILSACTRDLDAIAEVIEGPFLLGDQPTSYDCSVYAMIEHIRRTPTAHPLVGAVKGRASLCEHADRMHARIGWS